MSSDPEQEYFSDGICEDILTGLSRYRELAVVSRGSSFAFKGLSVDVSEAASQLGAQYVLEGSIRKAGDRVRITAQLIDGATGNHIWAESYDRVLDDVFAIQDDVVSTIVSTLAGRIEAASRERAAMTSPKNLTAYEHVVLELARCEYIERRENLIALGNSGTGKTHIALGLGLAACQKGLSVGFITAAALVHELIEARDDKQLLRFQKKLATYKLLIVDELGFVPLSKTGAELLFEVFSQRYERGSTLVTTNLPFDEWTEVFGSERLTGALLDRLTHHVNILEMNGDSYRLNQSRRRQTPTAN